MVTPDRLFYALWWGVGVGLVLRAVLDLLGVRVYWPPKVRK